MVRRVDVPRLLLSREQLLGQAEDVCTSQTHSDVTAVGYLFFQGTSIGKCPKNKLFKGYIELELQLREFDRCRKLYEKFLEFGPENCTSWIKFAELETILGDIERARAIYELAISQPRLDMPEVRPAG